MNAVSAWASDALVRANLKRSLGVRALLFIGMAVGAVLTRGNNRIEWFGICLVSLGAIACAVELLEMQQDGRLDQIRLSGRPPDAFLVSFIASTAGPWVIAGLCAIAVARVVGGVSQSLGETAVIIGFFLALVAAGMRIGLRQSSVDPRLAVAALIAGGMLIAIVGESARTFLLQLRAMTAPLLIAIEIAFLIWVTRPLVRLIAYPPAAGAQASWGARMPQRLWMLRTPGLFRGVTVAFNGMVLLAVFVPMVIFLRLVMPPPRPDGETAFLFVGPLIIGVVTISILCREDAISGRLEIIRQSAMMPWRTGLQMAVGLWTPFVLVSLVLALLTSALFFVTATGALATIVALILIAPLPIVEGWSRFWPLTYMMPFVFSLPFLTRSWPTLLVLSALHWYGVPRKFANPHASVLSGWPAVAAAAAVSGTLGLIPSRIGPGLAGLAIAPTLLAISPLLIADKESPRLRLIAPLAAALAVGVVAVWHQSVVATLSMAIAAGLTWVAAMRLVVLLPAWPVGQAVTRLVVLAVLTFAVVVIDLVARGHVQSPWLLVIEAAGVCAAAEIASRAAVRFRGSATPPA